MPSGESRQAIRPSRKNLFRVWLIRSILVAALLAILAYLKYSSQVLVPWYPLLLTLLLMALINLALLYRFKLQRPVNEGEFFANLLLDILFLTIVLYLTGGSTNPLVSYYLIPLIISAAVLRPRFTWSIALLTLACYTFLLFRYRPLGLFALSSHGSGMGAHYIGMWINFVFSAVLIAWFVVRMAVTMRGQERSITRVREQGMRDEQIISLASIAAGTAHELRTPLATMTVLAGEMQNDHPELEEDLTLLQDQLLRCDSILRELLSATADSDRKEEGTVGQLFSDVLQKWGIARPEVRVDVVLPDSCTDLRIRYDQSLHHALQSFLNNAADVSADEIRLSALEEGDTVLIMIEDRGPGVPAEIADSLGRSYISRKEGGLGLGVMLSSASIERLDGQVALLNRPGGGTRLEIRLPFR